MVVYSFGEINIITFDVDVRLDARQLRPHLSTSSTSTRSCASLALSVGATVACLLIGFPVALFDRPPARGARRRSLLVLVMVPFWTSLRRAHLRARQPAGRRRPAGHADLAGSHLGDDSPGILYTPTAIAIGIVYSYLPLMILPLFVALERIDPDLLHAAARPRAPRAGARSAA